MLIIHLEPIHTKPYYSQLQRNTITLRYIEKPCFKKGNHVIQPKVSSIGLLMQVASSEPKGVGAKDDDKKIFFFFCTHTFFFLSRSQDAKD